MHPHPFPQRRCAPGNLYPDAAFQLIRRDVVGYPGAAAAFDIVHHRLHPVQRLGKDRVGGRRRLELFPQRAQLCPQVGWQQPKDAVCSAGFCLGRIRRRVGKAVCRVDRYIAHVDLDQIVQDQHPDHPVDAHIGAGLISQHHRIKRQMPAVFARVFPA